MGDRQGAANHLHLLGCSLYLLWEEESFAVHETVNK